MVLEDPHRMFIPTGCRVEIRDTDYMTAAQVRVGNYFQDYK